MPSLHKSFIRVVCSILCAVSIPDMRAQTTNSLTAGNAIDYTINGAGDPGFTLQRGVTYVFQLSNLAIHPFWIKSVLGGNFSGGTGAFNTGVINNGASSGSVIFTVSAGAPNPLFYQCGNHAGMSGVLTIVTPASPPVVRIVHINVADIITLKSTGTNGNGWSVIPEFNCGLATTNWSAINPFTNSFNSGTNTTTFPRLEAVCGSTNVLILIRNQLN